MRHYPATDRVNRTVKLITPSVLVDVYGRLEWSDQSRTRWKLATLRAGLDLDVVDDSDQISGPVHRHQIRGPAGIQALSELTWVPRRPGLRWAAIVRGWGGTLATAVQVPPGGYPTSLYAWRDAAEAEGLTTREAIPPSPEDAPRGRGVPPMYRHRLRIGYARLLCREILDDTAEAVLSVSVPQ